MNKCSYITGFTLIEVLLAMLIVTLSIMGALILSTQTTQSITEIKNKTMGYYISNNALTQKFSHMQQFNTLSNVILGNSIQSQQKWTWKIIKQKQTKHLLNLSVKVYSPINKVQITENNVQMYTN